MALKKDFLIEKRNALNEMRSTITNTTELRFLLIYLSKINARDIATREVVFKLDDYVKIMEIGKVNVQRIQGTTDRLLKHVVNQPLPSGGFTAFQLFRRCKLEKDMDGDWCVIVDAHDDALPLMFQFRREYFKYELWNTLRLSSPNQVRMYEILKQHEHLGSKVFQLDELKGLLWLDKSSYPDYNNFKRRVLDKAQTALQETTDICFTYEPIRKGQGGKISAIAFTISKNREYIDQLTLAEFIDVQGAKLNMDDNMDDETIAATVADAIAAEWTFYGEALGKEFSINDVKFLYQIALPYVQKHYGVLRLVDVQLKMYDYFQLKYSQLKAYKKPIKNRFGLLRTFIEADVKKEESI
jgi:hypothetical protein